MWIPWQFFRINALYGMFFRTGALGPKSFFHDRLFFVCPFVHLAAWYKSLHDCVNLAPQCGHSYILAAFGGL